MHPAKYWESAPDGRAQCRLCPHACLITEGHAGRCGVRVLRGGILLASGYGMLSGAQADPVEKKPLYHFYPGAEVFSIGGWGCNLSCLFCQNWGISQQIGRSNRIVMPADVVASALRGRVDPAPAIAYTYNEPLINFEFVHDCARAARAAGVQNILVTNGLINPAPAADLLPMINALNIDIKSMDPRFYREYCGGPLAPVLAFARQARAAGCHLEITNLVIPGLNDAETLFQEMAGWIRDNLGAATPLHLSAYHPAYRVDLPPTPPETLEHAAAVCRRALHYVYLGNVASPAGQDTRCPQCGLVQIERRGYRVRRCGLKGAVCAGCGRPADMVL